MKISFQSMKKILLILALAVVMTACVSNQTKIKNADIDKTITELSDIEKNETDINKKMVFRKANEQLNDAKNTNIENDRLTKKMQSDKKFVIAGKFLYSLLGIAGLICVALFVVKIIKHFK